MNGTTITSSTQIGNNTYTSWHIVASGDFNGDGDSDVLWQNASGQVDMWLMNGTTITSSTQISSNSDPTWKVVATGDFNGDGKSDILVQNSSSGQVDMWLMNGTTITSSTQIGNNTDPNWKVVTTGDYNGDGMSDILWQNSNSGQTIEWVMSGTSILSNVFVAQVGSQFQSPPGMRWRRMEAASAGILAGRMRYCGRPIRPGCCVSAAQNCATGCGGDTRSRQ